MLHEVTHDDAFCRDRYILKFRLRNGLLAISFTLGEKQSKDRFRDANPSLAGEDNLEIPEDSDEIYF